MARGRFFKCLSCGLEANRDAVGVLNVGYLHEVALAGGLLLRWEPRRAMNNQSMNTLEAGISRLQPWRVSNNMLRKPIMPQRII